MFFKKLSNRDSPKEGNLHLTYFNVLLNSSPTLKIILRSFFYSSPMGWVPLPRSFPTSWYCKLDTGMQQPKLHPELFMQHKDCNLTCCSDPVNFTGPYTNLAWCSFPDTPHSKLVYLNNPLTKIYLY